ncbi:hypothetical protein EV401DRAFT_1891752 [Pisolithus croceorrhizus]|nr:hypothetical protein EV401DRAFT_1891752 [Pisolithus croceorrhizus]
MIDNTSDSILIRLGAPKKKFKRREKFHSQARAWKARFYHEQYTTTNAPGLRNETRALCRAVICRARCPFRHVPMLSMLEFEPKDKVTKTQQGDAFIYAGKGNNENAGTYKISGKFHLFVDKIQTAETAGSLRDDVTLTTGFPPFVGDAPALMLKGKNVVLEYSIGAVGSHYDGRMIIVTLPLEGWNF